MNTTETQLNLVQDEIHNHIQQILDSVGKNSLTQQERVQYMEQLKKLTALENQLSKKRLTELEEANQNWLKTFKTMSQNAHKQCEQLYSTF